MTTDLDERITRVLTARADALTVTRPPLPDAAARVPIRSRRPLLVAAAVLVVALGAAAVAATRSDEGGTVDVRPAEEATTTTTAPAEVPVVDPSYLPEGFSADPTTIVAPDRQASVTTFVAGNRAIEVALVRTTRTPDLETALDARRTVDIVAAYAAGGSVPTGTGLPATPLADDVLGAVTALPQRPFPVQAHAQPGDDPYLLGLTATPGPGQPTDLSAVAFRADVEVRLTVRGVRLDEALAVLRGLDGPGLAPRARPDAAPLTAAPVPAGTDVAQVGLTSLPEGWAMDGVFTDAAAAMVTFAPAGGAVDPEAVFEAPPTLTVTLERNEPLPEEADALASGDDVAIAEAFSRSTAMPWATGGERRVLRVGEVVVVLATGTVDGSTVADLATTHEITWANAFLGPDLALEINAQGLDDAALTDVIRGLVVIT
ncbi:MAG TPA: hypothetical protein VF228_15010 [Iamia sp.]